MLFVTIILFIITVITHLVCPDHGVAGGAKKPFLMHPVKKWLDPKTFVEIMESSDPRIGAGQNPSEWIPIKCHNWNEWQTLFPSPT